MPRSPQDRTKVNLFLQSDVLAALKKMATIRGTTYSDLVREACRRFVVSEGSKLVKEQQQLAAMSPSPPVPTMEDVEALDLQPPNVEPGAFDEPDPRERG